MDGSSKESVGRDFKGQRGGLAVHSRRLQAEGGSGVEKEEEVDACEKVKGLMAVIGRFH